MAAQRKLSRTTLGRLRRRVGHGGLFGGALALLTLGLILWTRWQPGVDVSFDPGPLPPNSLKGVTVIIDPGHGGRDPGMTAPGVREADLTYRTAATLARVLREAGARTHFTIRSQALTEDGPIRRPLDAAPEVAPNRPLRSGREHKEDLYARGDLAARHWDRGVRPLYFISLHYDSSGLVARTGGHVIWDRRKGASPPRLAKNIARRFKETGLCGLLPPTPVPRGLGMLSPGRNPVPESVLVECATLTSPADRRAAQSARWREALCNVLAHSVRETAATSRRGAASTSSAADRR